VAKRPHLLFLTGKLAEPALQRMLDELAGRIGFEYTVVVLPITVVALATTPWIARHLSVPEGVDRIVVPGLCAGELSELAIVTSVPVERGPADLRDLPEHFGTKATSKIDYGAYDIEILAEINHAPRLSHDEFLRQARAYHMAGAEVIDVGCDPGYCWNEVGDAVRALRDEGMRVSIDSFNPVEVLRAVRAGAELVLSVDRTNVKVACDWGVEVVVLPDTLATLDGLDANIETLTRSGVRFRIDPVIEPIGFGFAASLGRYLEVRRRYPNAEMLMGVGNLTELTDVDSAGVNVMLLGFCQEVGIRSVLTTEVINWSRSCVRELDLARRLVHFACTRRVLPKHLEPNLVMLRDPRLRPHGAKALEELAAMVKDRNFRIFAEEGRIHVINAEMHLIGEDPFVLFEQICEQAKLDPAHAFYLGYEMAKAVTALTLGKNYTQDQALKWGFLTSAEASHRHRM
jgi:dihydropteroate synthase-like protein